VQGLFIDLKVSIIMIDQIKKRRE